MTTRKVTFILPNYIAKGADSGFLLGDFNNWNLDQGIPLIQNEHGDLYATVELISGEFYQYRYFLGNGRWENDDNAQSYYASQGNAVENCVVFVSAAEEYKTEHTDIAEKKTEKKSTKKPTAKVPPLKTEKKSGATTKINTAKEDLSLIEEISKSTADLLNQKGINSFSRLSKSTIKSLKELLEEAGPKYENINPSNWPKAAKAFMASKPKAGK